MIACIIEAIVTVPIGIVLIIFGLLLWKKQRIQLLHDYHHARVKQQDVGAYTKLWGIGLIVLGVCACPIAVIDYVSHTWLGWILFIIGMTACLIMGNKAQKTYNGSWFS